MEGPLYLGVPVGFRSVSESFISYIHVRNSNGANGKKTIKQTPICCPLSLKVFKALIKIGDMT